MLRAEQQADQCVILQCVKCGGGQLQIGNGNPYAKEPVCPIAEFLCEGKTGEGEEERVRRQVEIIDAQAEGGIQPGSRIPGC